MATLDPNQASLRKLLRLNGAFSSLSALGLLAMADRIHAAVGLPEAAMLHSTAIGLLLFALALFGTAAPARIPLGPVWAIIALDLLWVLYSFGALAMPAGPTSTAGAVGILAVAIIVGTLGVLQLRSALRVRTDRRAPGRGASAGVA